MKARQIAIVFGKEVTDMIRDRRTLISMVVVPVLLMPLLVLGMGFLTAVSVRKAQEEVPPVMILGGAKSPRIMEALQARQDLRLVPPQPDFTNQINSSRVRPPDYKILSDKGLLLVSGIDREMGNRILLLSEKEPDLGRG